ncbi:L-galactose dehydrogenase [Hyalella azteca]|uniref:L-galactose dehydrogenase n=1 Tax=Hyalella azteca TaxID=294128 RepID=A0A979FH72_HYAAZ|nr:L-galactose dehydrogenase [Hyalella azteca]XP_047736058.1 L-galactose dehydrogenase [Hyalella azteca]
MEEKTYVEGFHDKDAVKKVQYNDLGKTGLRVSQLGIGTSSLGNCYEVVGEAADVEMVVEGVRLGLNYVDTAPWYGNRKSEQVLGKALLHVLRKAYYIATKVGRYEPNFEKMFDFSAAKTIESVDQSLQLLGLEYVDVIQVHDVEFADDINQVILETLPALEKVRQQGKARFIGITSYCPDVLQYVLDNSSVKIDTVLNYARSSLLDKSLQEYIPRFQSAGVGIINASITSMGLLSSRGPQSWHPAGYDIQRACEAARALCKAEGVEIADLALQSAIATPSISCHLLGSTDAPMLRASLAVAQRPATSREASLGRRLNDECFKNLKQRDWGMRDVEIYLRERQRAS